jgi:protein TonB
MRFSEILISVMLHAGLAAGMMYGLSQNSADDIDEIPIEPIYFDIVEESKALSHLAEDIPEGPVPAIPEGSVPAIKDHVPLSAVKPVVPVEPSSIESNPTEVAPGSVSPAKKPMEHKREEVSPEREVPIPIAQQEQAKVVSEPRALSKIIPVYPRSARRRGREGIVTLEISISASGEVSDTAVVESSGYRDLDSAAVSAVGTARFAPAMEDGVNVHGRLRLTFEFKLR